MKIIKYIVFIFLLVSFCVADEISISFDNPKYECGAKGWRILGKGIAAEKKDSSIRISKKENFGNSSVFFNRITVEPSREYKLSVEGKGECSLALSPSWGSPRAIKMGDISLDGKPFEKQIVFPADLGEIYIVQIRMANNGKPFELSKIELTPKPDPKGWIRLDRKKLRKNRPAPAVVRGISCENTGEKEVRALKKYGGNITEIKVSAADSAADMAKKMSLVKDAGLKAVVDILSKSEKSELAKDVKAAAEKLSAFKENIWAYSVSSPALSRDEFNSLIKDLRKNLKDEWFVFKTGAENLAKLNPVDDYKIIYAAEISDEKQIETAKIFRNVLPAPMLAVIPSSLAWRAEEALLNWIITTTPEKFSADISDCRRPLVKSADKQTQLDDIARAFKKSARKNALNFAFAADTHFFSNPKNPRQFGAATIDHMRDMAKTAADLKLDFVANGGDIIAGFKPKKDSLADLRQIYLAMSQSNLPVFVSIGNHDDGTNYSVSKKIKGDSEAITQEEWFDACIADTLKFGATGDAKNPKAKYFFLDFPAKKVRVINLAISENNMKLDKNGTFIVDSIGFFDISGRQLDWLCRQALDFSDKPDRKDWGVVLLSHQKIGRGMPNGKILFSVLDAFQNGKSFAGNAAKGFYPSKISCDFSKQGKMKILANIAGDIHEDVISYSSLGFVQIEVLNAKNRAESPEAPPRNFGQADDASWSIISIDKDANKFRLLRFGAGCDVSGELEKR